jgi:ribosomal protein S27AE
MNNETIAGFCPRCNKVVAAEVHAWAYGQPSGDIFDRLDPEEDGLSSVKYKLAFCPACHGVFLQRSCLSEPSEFRYEEIIYPKQSKLPLVPPYTDQFLQFPVQSPIHSACLALVTSVSRSPSTKTDSSIPEEKSPEHRSKRLLTSTEIGTHFWTRESISHISAPSQWSFQPFHLFFK